MSKGIDINYINSKLSNSLTNEGTQFASKVVNSSPLPQLSAWFTMAEEETDDYLAYSRFGTPVVNAIFFLGGKYQVYDQKGNLSQQSISDFMLPATSVVNFTRKKTITKTPTIGGKGTVKEIYSIEEWEINISGTCLTDITRKDHQTAHAQQLALDEYNRVAGSINILGDRLFNDKEIAAITIEDIQFKTKPGSPDEVEFEIKATSDNPAELDL